MTKTCSKCRQPFVIPKAQLVLLEKMAVLTGDRRFPIPPPTYCPDCRKQRRLSFRNDLALYYRPSSLSGKRILSVYSPDKPYQVYSYDEWWGDSWDALNYGREFDFSRPFAGQFAELQLAVPRLNLYVDNLCENCEFSNQLTMSKNCYLVCSGSSNQDCFYSYRLNNSRDCSDCLYCISSELCFECVDCAGCYNCRFCQNTTNSSDSFFLLDCQNCHCCAFSIGLRNQSHCLFNQPCSQQQFTTAITRFSLSSRCALGELTSRFREFVKPFPRKFAALKQVENTTGDNVQNAKNCSHVFDGANLEDVHFAQFVQDAKDCVDVNFCCDNTTLHYEVATSGIDAYNIAFSIDTWPTASSLLYCDSCSNGTSNCFGCIGLRRSQYCILNRQYEPPEYEKMVIRIISHMQQTGEWGEFFPSTLSPFAYNESTAFDLFPLTREQAVSAGLRWKDEETKETIDAEAQVPDDSRTINSGIGKQRFACSSCKRSFRITPQELALYQKLNVAAPNECFLCRHRRRLAQRNPRRLWQRECAKCRSGILTTFSPERPEIVYCEDCYLRRAVVL